MMNENVKNNQATLKGTVLSDPKFSHEVYGKKFFEIKLEVRRLSETPDIIPIIISEESPLFSQISIGKRICVVGPYRSYNECVNKKSKLILTVYAVEIRFLSEDEQDDSNIILEGVICRNVIYRKTPLGKRIADVMLAVSRPYPKKDYIPCIAWGQDACWAAALNVGDKIRVNGRIQSRDYEKKLPNGTTEIMVAYEVSINNFEVKR